MRQNVITRATLTMLLWILAIASAAQNVDGLKFEVASVKPAGKEELGSEIRTDPGGRLTITNIPLRAMIMYAWQINRTQISGSKGWIESQGYDIVAKADRAPKDEEMKSMLRTLLIERFRLVLHSETTDQTLYVLGTAKPGKVGPS